LSPTCIKTFNQCLLKYWYQYIKKEKGIEDAIHLRFGTTVHSALEELGRRLHAGEPLTRDLCEEIAQRVPHYAAENQVDNAELIKEGQQFIRDRYYRHNPHYQVVATELSMFKLNLTTNKGIPLNGVIDLFMQMDPTTAIVLDYKTSRKADTTAEAKVDIQLSMYDLIISKLYPQYKHIWLVLDFLRSEPVLSDRTIEERTNFEAWLNGLWHTMGQLTEKDVVATVNEYCPWCKFKHMCNEYEGLLKAPMKLKPIMAITQPEEFTEEWRLAKVLEKTAEGRLKELKSWADKKVAMDGTVQFEDDKSVVSWGQGSRRYYDPNALVGQIPVGDLSRLISFKNKDLEEYSHSRPDLRPLIERASRNSPGAPRITIRNK
jgi:RecB family exonuclease